MPREKKSRSDERVKEMKENEKEIRRINNNNTQHDPAPVLENNTHKLLWDFDIHTDHLISASRPDLIITKNKTEMRELAKLSTLLSRPTTE